MKNAMVILFFLMSVYPTSAQSPDSLLRGIWANEDNTSQFKFTHNGNNYSAQLVWMAQPNDENGNPKKDSNNPDKTLRNRPLLGMTMISGLEFKNNEWVNGTIYNPRKGISVKCQIEMPNDDTLILKASKGLFSVTKTWKRIK